ncbi:uncharacterized protein [Aegilops tauschii subsp. strangulata]|uniref:uncharacterized protein n=1 Tax=Aegilops tauschii subsp. strangulata TaxID=200361 RepID=UPI00098A3BDE
MRQCMRRRRRSKLLTQDPGRWRRPLRHEDTEKPRRLNDGDHSWFAPMVGGGGSSRALPRAPVVVLRSAPTSPPARDSEVILLQSGKLFIRPGSRKREQLPCKCKYRYVGCCVQRVGARQVDT